MSLSVDGVWKLGVWAQTIWAEGVWREGDHAHEVVYVTPSRKPQISASASSRRIFGSSRVKSLRGSK